MTQPTLQQLRAAFEAGRSFEREKIRKIIPQLESVDPTPEIIGQTIIDLNLSDRPYDILRRNKIVIVAQLLSMTEDDVLDLTNFGQKSMDELKAKLGEFGLQLKPS